MDLNRLKSFCYVAKTNSYRGAEKSLGQNFSTIRKRILALEKELGILLFETHDGRLVLTPQGKAFYDHAARIIDGTENELREFEEAQLEMKGQLTIATTTAMANLWLVDAISNFIEAYPDIQIQIKSSDADLDLFMREADASIMVANRQQTDLEILPIIKYHMTLVASEEYLKQYGTPKSVEDLQNHRIISYGEDVPTPYENINWHMRYLPTDFRPAIAINSMAGVFRFVEKGLGIGAVSQKGIDISKTPLKRILPDILPGEDFQVAYCYPKSRKESKKIRALYDYVKNHFI